MLNARANRGMTLIEIVITLALFSMLAMMGAPSMSQWLHNNRIRASAQSLLNGLQFAQAEAVSRNSRVRFQLTTTLGDDCILKSSGGNWVVNLDPYANPAAVESHCAAAASDSDSPFILTKRSVDGTTKGAALTSTASTVVFNGLGRPTPRPVAPINIDVAFPGDGDCAADGGQARCMRIVISPEGMLRMCDPARNATDPTDSTAC